jgi:hypothetical protein
LIRFSKDEDDIFKKLAFSKAQDAEKVQKTNLSIKKESEDLPLSEHIVQYIEGNNGSKKKAQDMNLNGNEANYLPTLVSDSLAYPAQKENIPPVSTANQSKAPIARK